MARVIMDSEKELEDWIVRRLTEGTNPFIRVRTRTPSLIFQQFNLGSYGIADIVAVYLESRKGHDGITRNYCEIDVIEVKKGAIGAATFSQVARYMTGLVHAFEDVENIGDVEIFGFIVGTEWTQDDCFITGWMSNVSACIAEFDMEHGLRLTHEHGWRNTRHPTLGCGDELHKLISDLIDHANGPAVGKGLKVVE